MLPEIPGEWMQPDWGGAVLKHSTLLKLDSDGARFEMVHSFYKKGIEALISINN